MASCCSWFVAVFVFMFVFSRHGRQNLVIPSTIAFFRPFSHSRSLGFFRWRFSPALWFRICQASFALLACFAYWLLLLSSLSIFALLFNGAGIGTDKGFADSMGVIISTTATSCATAIATTSCAKATEAATST